LLVPQQQPVTYASRSFWREADPAGAVDLMHRIRTEFRYDLKATAIPTPLEEVFEQRHGVRQDFAHVMIAGLRGLTAGRLCQRLPGTIRRWANRACRMPQPMPGLAVVRRGPGVDRVDPTNDILVENDHIGFAGRDFSTSRRSMASSGSRRSLRSPSMCCWW
jgi:hypothetical protein